MLQYVFSSKRITLILILGCLSSCLGGGSNPKKSSSLQETSTPSQTDDQREPKDPPAPPVVNDPAPIFVPMGSDPLYAQSWHLYSTGSQNAFASMSAVVGEDLRTHNLHQQGILGSGVRVAISDNGVEVNHPDLIERHLTGESRDYTSSQANEWRGRDPYPTSSGEVAAHGTSVAGLALASGFNNLGSRGVAPLARFAGFNFVGAGTPTISKIIDQASGNFDLFNYSYGRDSCDFTKLSPSYHDQLRLGAMTYRQGRGALYVKAAGNEYLSRRSNCVSGLSGDYAGNANLESDNNEPWVIVVGATDPRGFAAYYSTPGSSLWISAPGGEIGVQVPALLTTDLTGCDKGFGDSANGLTSFDRAENPLNTNCNYTSSMNGTSGAAPLVTGGLALLLSVNPQLSWRDLKYVMAKTARKIDAGSRQITHPQGFNLTGHTYMRHWVTNAAGFHFHNWYGFGVFDAEAAVNYVRDHQLSLGAWQEVQHSSGTLSLGIPDNSAQGVNHSITVNEDWTVESVQIQLSVTHDYPSDLGVELRSPSGTVSTLMAINSGMVGTDLNQVTLSSNAFYFENARGQWQLKIIDAAAEDVGVLTNWQIRLMGHQRGSSSIQPKSVLLSEASRLRAFEVISNESSQQNAINRLPSSDQSPFASPTDRLSESSAGVRSFIQTSNSSQKLAQAQESLVTTELNQKRLKDVLMIEDKRVLVYSHEDDSQPEILLIHSDAKEELVSIDLTEDSRLLAVNRDFAKTNSLYFVNSNSLIKLDYEQNSWQQEIYSMPSKAIGQKNDQLIYSRQIGEDEQEILIHDQVSFKTYRMNSDGVLSLESTQHFPGLVGRGSYPILPLSHENSIRLLSLESKVVELESFELPRKLGTIHLHATEDENKLLAIAEMTGPGFWEKLGSFNLYVIELDLKSQSFEIKQSFETQGEDHLRHSVSQQKMIHVLGSTRANFADQNFGDLDLTYIRLDLKGDVKVKSQWGRQQKRIDSSGDDWGIRLLVGPQGAEIWAESTGPIFNAPLKTGWRSFMLKPGEENEL